MRFRRFPILGIPLLVGVLLLVGTSRRVPFPGGTSALVIVLDAKVLPAALSLVGPREAEASPCKGTGETCRTSRSCCSRRCVDGKAAGARFGDCRPVCRCGDGYIDPSCDGEECDDGNNAVCDGCSATCKTEHCDDGVPCTVDSCDPGTGCRNVPNDLLCDDVDAGTVDSCDPNCDPLFASCDPTTGCKHTTGGGCGCS